MLFTVIQLSAVVWADYVTVKESEVAAKPKCLNFCRIRSGTDGRFDRVAELDLRGEI